MLLSRIFIKILTRIIKGMFNLIHLYHFAQKNVNNLNKFKFFQYFWVQIFNQSVKFKKLYLKDKSKKFIR